VEPVLTFKDFNEALKQGRLVGLKCRDCGEITAQPILLCGKCVSANLESIGLTGKGIIQTFTVNYVAAEGREAEAPYIVAIVELEEGPWAMGNIVDLRPEEATIDIIGRKVMMSGMAVFPGDKYSAGDIARPLFKME
jgi:uncharacterized OB-fold protein